MVYYEIKITEKKTSQVGQMIRILKILSNDNTGLSTTRLTQYAGVPSEKGKKLLDILRSARAVRREKSKRGYKWYITKSGKMIIDETQNLANMLGVEI